MGETSNGAGPIPKVAVETEVLKCPCGSSLFACWGMEIIYNPRTWNVRDFGGESQDAGRKFTRSWVDVCMMCKTPYVLYDGQLFDISELVSAEEVQAGLNTLAFAPTGAKANIIDP